MRKNEDDKTPKERGVAESNIVKWSLTPEQITQAFEEGDRPNLKAYGLLGVYLLGTYFHLEFVEVHPATIHEGKKLDQQEGALIATDDEHQSTIDELQHTMDCDFATTEIDDRTYVIFMTPHED